MTVHAHAVIKLADYSHISADHVALWALECHDLNGQLLCHASAKCLHDVDDCVLTVEAQN